MEKESFKKIITIDNAIDVLMALSSQSGKSIRELGHELDISKSTLHRILLTLKSRDFVKQDPISEKYSLGYQILELSIKLKEQSKLRDMALPYMKKLSNLTGDTVQLGILDKDEILILESIEGTNLLRVFSQAGQRFPITYGNFGKVFLSQMSTNKINEFIERYPLKKYAMNSITDPKLFLERIEKVKNENISISEDDPTDGAISLVVPVRDETDNIVGAISLALAKTPKVMDSVDELRNVVKQTANDITNKLKELALANT